MTTLARRDDAALTAGLRAWSARQWPDDGYEVAALDRPKAGWTNETLLVTLRRDRAPREMRVVVRLPPAVPTWPRYDLGAQGRLLDALASSAVPVPRVLAYESDAQWLGAAFLVMSHEAGRPGAEAPALDRWVTESEPQLQRYLHEGFVDMLATIHRVDWRAAGLEGVVRGGEQWLAREVSWWSDYVEWASDGEPTPALADAAAWCAATVPDPEPPASLCWGDARVGNVLFDDDRNPASVLDWELATIGPAEMDLAWYLALDELTTHFVRRSVPGFLDRAEIIERYERALGRPVDDLAWHEIFALVRSTAINDRQARLAAESGVAYPGVAGAANPVLGFIAERIGSFTPR